MSTKKVPVRMSKQMIMEVISLMNSCYDLQGSDENEDIVNMINYLNKRLEAF